MNKLTSSGCIWVGDLFSSVEDLISGTVSWWRLIAGTNLLLTGRLFRFYEAKDPKFLQIHEGSVRALSIPILPHQSSLFLSRQSPIFLGRYRWTGEWLLCRIFCLDARTDTFTVVWQDGFLQVGTPTRDLRSLSPPLTERIMRQLVEACERMKENSLDGAVQGNTEIKPDARMEPMTINGLNIWEAAKIGDIETTLAIIDQGGATANDVELLDSQCLTNMVHQGRTPLYWACFGGHVELVRELLLRGGFDQDGAAYIAVTTRQVADDNKDILFDPDTGVYSDFVDYDPDSAKNERADDDDALLIRAMLMAVKATGSNDAKSLRHYLPKQLYHESSKECVVCWVNVANAAIVPCGHVACCTSCLTKVRKRRDGCPLCRGDILAVIPDSTVSLLSG